MRLIYDGLTWNPTDGAIIPHIIKNGIEGTKEQIKQTISNTFAEWLQAIGEWLSTDGILIAGEIALIWGLICLLIGCTGNGKWIEKGVTSALVSIFLGVSRVVINGSF